MNIFCRVFFPRFLKSSVKIRFKTLQHSSPYTNAFFYPQTPNPLLSSLFVKKKNVFVRSFWPIAISFCARAAATSSPLRFESHMSHRTAVAAATMAQRPLALYYNIIFIETGTIICIIISYYTHACTTHTTHTYTQTTAVLRT